MIFIMQYVARENDGDYALHSNYFVYINVQTVCSTEVILQPLCIDVKEMLVLYFVHIINNI